MAFKAFLCAAFSLWCVQGLLFQRAGSQSKQHGAELCKFDTYLNGTVQKKSATIENVIFRSRDVMVVQDGTTRIMVFRFQDGLGTHCNEQAQVQCGPSATYTGAQRLLQHVSGKAACAEYGVCQPDSTPNLGYARSMIGGAVSTTGDKLHRVALIGVGAGMIPLWFARTMPATRVDAIDISTDVIATAPCFGLIPSPQMKLVPMEGRKYLAGQQDGTYDAVFVDAITDKNYVPSCLKTVEFFQMVRSKLRLGGVLTMNIFRHDKKELNTVYMSLKKVFPGGVKVGLSPGLLNLVLLAQAADSDGSADGKEAGTTASGAGRLGAAHGWADEAVFQTASPKEVIGTDGVNVHSGETLDPTTFHDSDVCAS